MMSNNNNIIDITVKLSGLKPQERYDYSFSTAGANWPCIITPITGFVQPLSDNVSVKASLSFCENKSLCPSGTEGLLKYNDILSCNLNNNHLFANIVAGFFATTTNDVFYSEVIHLECKDCLPQIQIISPTPTTLDSLTTNHIKFNSRISGLSPNETYAYEFKGVDSNWPVKITPISGLISPSKNEFNLSSSLTFCLNTGICPNGSSSVLDYSLVETCSLDSHLFSTVQLSVTPVSCVGEKITSDQLCFYCEKCLPKVSVKISTSGINVYSLSKEQNDDTYLLQAKISGLTIDKNYAYEFISVDSNWPVFISPMSGILQSSSSSSSIISQLFFCSSSGLCPNGTKGVLSYDMDLDTQSKRYRYDPYVTLQMLIYSEACSDDQYSSDTFTIYCNDCLRPSDIKISSQPI